MTVEFLGKEYTSISDKKIVCNENGRKYEAENLQRKELLKIHVDGDLITEGERCDYALNVLCDNKIYLIELKGCDKPHAYEQLMSTINFLTKNKVEAKFLPRIVLSKDTAPKIKSSAEKRMDLLVKKNQCEKTIVKTRVMTEAI